MGNLKNILLELQEYNGEEWKKRLSAYAKGTLENVSQKEEQRYNDFIKAYRDAVIEHHEDDLKQVESLIDNDLLYNDLQLYANDVLRIYYASTPLRILEKTDYNKAQELIEYVLYNATIRNGVHIEDMYIKYGLENQDIFETIINIFDSLAEFSVVKNLQKDSITDVIYQNMRLSISLCEYIANIIDENFDKLQRKCIIQKLYQS